MKTTIIAVILTCVLLVSCACALPASAEERGESYPRLTIVTVTVLLPTDYQLVVCRDRDGNLWEFYSEEKEYSEGDIVNLLMWNMGDKPEYDEVMEVYWEGHTENIELWLKVNGWR